MRTTTLVSKCLPRSPETVQCQVCVHDIVSYSYPVGIQHLVVVLLSDLVCIGESFSEWSTCIYAYVDLERRTEPRQFTRVPRRLSVRYTGYMFTS